LQSDVKQLLQVQKVDQKIAHMRRQAESIPRERSQRLASLDGLKKATADQEAQKTASDLRLRELELSIRQSDSEIKNLEDKLGLIKNNAEYQAILFQIEAVKKERDAYEEESLLLLDKAGPVEEKLQALQVSVAEEQAVFDEFNSKADELIVKQEAEIAKVSAGRDALTEGVQVELVEEYGRLFEVRENLAIVAAESQYCQGCYTQFTMNDLARLQSGKTIVRCSSCQRILYLVE
jgi:predicted  nucleic acid-binding Zn-ribbon protein